MKIYISGSIAGQDGQGEAKFREAAEALQEQGHETVVPHDIDAYPHEGECPRSYSRNGDHTSACYMRADLIAMLHCDAVLMLPEWEFSVGARAEHAAAAVSGMKIAYLAQEWRVL